MSSATTTGVGQAMETAACRYLERRGLKLVDRNYRTKGGEIDLIMRDRDSLVFVEVRYRASVGHGLPAESISLAKQRRLLHAARAYLARFRVQPACRFDVVSLAGAVDAPKIGWIEAAFDATGGSWSP